MTSLEPGVEFPGIVLSGGQVHAVDVYFVLSGSIRPSSTAFTAA